MYNVYVYMYIYVYIYIYIYNKITQPKTIKEKTINNNKKMGIIVPTMNHYPMNGYEGDPEFSTK